MNTETTVELDVLLEFRDYLKASYWFLFRRVKLLFVLLLFAGLVYPLLLISRIFSQHPNDNYWGFLIPWVVLGIMLGGTYFSAKKNMASNKSLSEPIHYVFSESGIAVTAPSASGRADWNNIYEAHETKSNFLIFLANNLMYIIPKRCFHDAEQIASFKRLVRSQLNSKAKWH